MFSEATSNSNPSDVVSQMTLVIHDSVSALTYHCSFSQVGIEEIIIVLYFG